MQHHIALAHALRATAPLYGCCAAYGAGWLELGLGVGNGVGNGKQFLNKILI